MHFINDVTDVVGHMKLVNGQTLTERPVLEEVDIAAARHLLVHVQLHEYVYIYLLHISSLYFS